MVDIHNRHKLQTNYINFCTFVGLKVICTGCNTSSKGLSKRWTVFLLTLRSPTTWPPNTRTNTRMSRMSCTHFRKSLTKAVYSCQGKVFLADAMAFLYRGGGSGGGGVSSPDFGIIKGAARQRQRVALLLAHPDFQTLRHPWSLHTKSKACDS